MNFAGFSRETLQFFGSLGQNNNRQWFEAHRHIYDRHVLPEAQDFVVVMGERLRKISSDINADPRVDKSIFRLHRDTRFSKDKSPYKTHLGLVFWEGPFKKLEAPLFYFHLEGEKLFLAAGMHIFPKEFIPVYREAVVDQKKGAELDKVLEAVTGKDAYLPGWEKYKTVPRGFDAAHPRSELLKYGGIGFSIEMPPVDELFDDRAADFVFRHFENMAPIYLWLKKLIREKY